MSTQGGTVKYRRLCFTSQRPWIRRFQAEPEISKHLLGMLLQSGTEHVLGYVHFFHRDNKGPEKSATCLESHSRGTDHGFNKHLITGHSPFPGVDQLAWEDFLVAETSVASLRLLPLLIKCRKYRHSFSQHYGAAHPEPSQDRTGGWAPAGQCRGRMEE